MNILYVEDNEFNAMLIEMALKGRGYEVKVAKNPKEAMQIVKQNSFDLVLMDIHLGEDELDGITLMHKIRLQHPQYELTPFYALTAYAMPGDEVRFLAEGFERYYPKPIELPSFFNGLSMISQPA
ncbi:MAG: response regulator [Bacteroidota bacterium]